MRATYLTGARLSLRALTLADKETAAAWFDSPFPADATRAEAWLKETQRDPYESRRVDLLIVRSVDEATVGSATLHTNFRTGRLTFRMAPALPAAVADDLRAEALRLLIPWLRDDQELMTVVVPTGADEAATIAAAASLGMMPQVRLREHYARPGGRVDMLLYQAQFAPWRVADDDAAEVRDA